MNSVSAPPNETHSTCPYCGVGCGVIIETQGAQITGVRGGPDHPANFGRLCTKGSALHLTATSTISMQTRLMHGQDMQRLALADGDLVQVTSRRGSIVLPARASEQQGLAQAFIAMHWGDEYLSGSTATGQRAAGVNALTLPAICPSSKQPELQLLRCERAPDRSGAAFDQRHARGTADGVAGSARMRHPPRLMPPRTQVHHPAQQASGLTGPTIAVCPCGETRMAIASYIKEIGRGKEGARSLSEVQAHDLMSQVLDGTVTDLEIGAFALAMRIKGESIAELAGFLRAAHERCIGIAPTLPTIVLPSYNGARKLPNLTPLLALRLAQEGAQVLVHGPMRDPGRVSTAEVFHDLGLPFARNAEEIENGWLRREPVFIATDDLCPPLARLLAVRRVVGLRNSGHTIAKLLAPCSTSACLRVVNYTHPEYATMLGEFLAHTGGDAMLLRGTEGEPVADPRRAPKLEVFIAGKARADLSRAAHEGVLTELPLLPRGFDAATTAVYIQAVVSGEKPAPGPLTQQVECLMAALGAIDCNAPKEQMA